MTVTVKRVSGTWYTLAVEDADGLAVRIPLNGVDLCALYDRIGDLLSVDPDGGVE